MIRQSRTEGDVGFTHWVEDRIRMSDLDFQKHVNNAVFSALLSNGRYAFLSDTVRPHLASEDMLVVARLEIDFLAPLHYGPRVRTGTRLLSRGRTSLRLRQGVFQAETIAARAETVIVLVDGSTGTGKPWPQAIENSD